MSSSLSSATVFRPLPHLHQLHYSNNNIMLPPPPPLLVLANSSSLTDHEDEEEEEEGFMDIHRGEALDAIDDAWDESKDELHLYNIRLDQYSMNFLLKKWNDLYAARWRGPQGQGKDEDKPRRTIQTLVLDRCSFSSKVVAHLMVVLLESIGSELKNVRLVDSSGGAGGGGREHAAGPLRRGKEESCTSWTLLQGLRYVGPLEKLCIESADLRGEHNGLILQALLANNVHLQSLRLPGCSMDNDMLQPFLRGLSQHYELKRLDLAGWNLTDPQLHALVHALVHFAVAKKLKILDLSGCKSNRHKILAIATSAASNHPATTCYKSLALLLKESHTLQEVVLSESFLWVKNEIDSSATVPAPPDGYTEFVQALDNNTTLRRLRLGSTQLLGRRHRRDASGGGRCFSPLISQTIQNNPTFRTVASSAGSVMSGVVPAHDEESTAFGGPQQQQDGYSTTTTTLDNLLDSFGTATCCTNNNFKE